MAKNNKRGEKTMNIKVSKKYIERQYDMAILDFKFAKTEEEQWNARKSMARLENLAGTCYGSEYMDELHKKINL